jgi:hypothetical protein
MKEKKKKTEQCYLLGKKEEVFMLTHTSLIRLYTFMSFFIATT